MTHIEDCFDGSLMLQYSFDAAWQRDRIMRLATLGRLDYFPDFPRPFFRLRGERGIEVKGVEGEKTCRVLLPRHEQESARQSFEHLFNGNE